MSNREILKTRKDHECAYCHEIIPRGSKAFYVESKVPVYDNDGRQVSVKYDKGWFHEPMLCGFCKDSDHIWVKAIGDLGVNLGYEICKECGILKEDVMVQALTPFSAPGQPE